ncbi:MAG: precorrin-2 C(20)-methyltransferase [Desulfotomaculales bacterium]
MPGTLYGVGIGPGDPELVTLRALRILERVPVVAVPRARREGESLAGEVVAALLGPGMGEKKVLDLHFPMTRDTEVLARAWREAAQDVVRYLKQGDDVACVTLGDPSFYSTYPHLRKAVRQILPTARTETVPGVPSFCACTAAAAWAMVQGDEKLAVVPVTGKTELEPVLRDFDGVVVLKAGRHLDQVRAALLATGREHKAFLFERCSLPGARWGPLTVFDAADYLSLVVVRK